MFRNDILVITKVILEVIITKLLKTSPGTVHLIVHTSFEMIFKLIKLYVKPVTTWRSPTSPKRRFHDETSTTPIFATFCRRRSQRSSASTFYRFRLKRAFAKMTILRSFADRTLERNFVAVPSGPQLFWAILGLFYCRSFPDKNFNFTSNQCANMYI